MHLKYYQTPKLYTMKKITVLKLLLSIQRYKVIRYMLFMPNYFLLNAYLNALKLFNLQYDFIRLKSPNL